MYKCLEIIKVELCWLQYSDPKALGCGQWVATYNIWLNFCLIRSWAPSTSLFTTSAAGKISLMRPTLWPAYITMLSMSPVVVTFGTVPARRRISISCWSVQLENMLRTHGTPTEVIIYSFHSDFSGAWNKIYQYKMPRIELKKINSS